MLQNMAGPVYLRAGAELELEGELAATWCAGGLAERIWPEPAAPAPPAVPEAAVVVTPERAIRPRAKARRPAPAPARGRR